MFLLLALAVAATFLIGIQSMFRSGWQGYARPMVNDYADRLAAEIGTPPDLARAQALAQRLPLRIRIDGPQLQWDSHPGRRSWDRYGDDDTAWHPVRRLADGHRISFSLAGLAQERRSRVAGWVTLATLLVLTALAYGYARHLLRPLHEIRAGAIRYGDGDFSQPIVVRRRDQLGVLAEQINAMATELRERLEAKRALLLAISHELRSPLTRARVNAELVDDSAERTALLRDLGQMRDLITDLLESERLAAGHEALQREACDLNALVRELVDAQFAGRAIELQLDASVPTAWLDPARIRLLVRNLLDNALRHSAGAPVELRTARDGDTLRLVVRDRGPGVAPEQLARLAQAFYRPDQARQRETGGVGLGLYLCRLVAQAHGGQLEFRAAAPGLEVTLSLPLVAPA
jgi:signal transduction histidine kinase